MNEQNHDVSGSQAGESRNPWLWPVARPSPPSVPESDPQEHVLAGHRIDEGRQDISDGGHRLAVRDAALQPDDINQRPFSSESGEVDPDRFLGSTGNLKHVMSTALPPGIEPSDVTDPGTKARAAALAAARAGASTEAGAAAQRQTRLREQRDADNRDIGGTAAGAPRPDRSD